MDEHSHALNYGGDLLYLVAQFEVYWWVRHSKYNSRLFINLHVEVWGTNMDYQLILEPRMVMDYTKKYVMKSNMDIYAAYGRLMKSLFHKTVQNKRHSVQSFLRRTMSKCLSEIIMSKQENFHLMLGIPIIYCSHKQIKLISKMSLDRLW